MKLFGKIIAVLMMAAVFAFPASAEENAEIFNTVKVYFKQEDIPTIVENKVEFYLYDEAGANLLDKKEHLLKRGEKAFEIEFSVPDYVIGTKFKFAVSDGVKNTYHDGAYSKEHILETYSMPDENGIQQYYTSFYMDLSCYWNKEAIIKIPGNGKVTYYHCLTADEVYVTLDLLAELDIKYQPHFDAEKPYFILYTDKDHSAYFYMNDIFASFGYQGENLSIPTFEISGMPYVPLSRVAAYFACNYSVVEENDKYREISLTKSAYSPKRAREEAVNVKNISSKTDYMIWVSKKDFEVNVFCGNKNAWNLVSTFPCSIGKVSTPTVEGQFEYYQYHSKWLYDKYYCGPVMRFYNGYAFHSYLIKYDGTPYDSRLGFQISAGCVRMHPDDIKWMTENIPLYTRILITP